MDHKELRKQAKQKLGKYGSLEVTWAKFDCGLTEDGTQNGCGECVMCKYTDFLDYVDSVGKPTGSTIAYNKFKDKYLKLVYGYGA